MSTFIHPTAIIGPNVELGENVEIAAYAVIGTIAEHKGHQDQVGKVIIGDNCVIREFCTVNAGTTEVTTIEKGVWMLRGSHVGHDAYLEEGVTLSCNVLIGGHVHVMKYATLGLGAIVHQRCVIGSYSMVGMGSVVTKKTFIHPGHKVCGNPVNRFLGFNWEHHNIAGVLYPNHELRRWEELCQKKQR